MSDRPESWHRSMPGKIKHVLGDTAHDGDETRACVRQLRAKACIKPHKNRTTKKRYATSATATATENRLNASSAESNNSAESPPATKRPSKTSPVSSGSRYSRSTSCDCPHGLKQLDMRTSARPPINWWFLVHSMSSSARDRLWANRHAGNCG